MSPDYTPEAEVIVSQMKPAQQISECDTDKLAHAAGRVLAFVDDGDIEMAQLMLRELRWALVCKTAEAMARDYMRAAS